jgi:hypothetical protein
VTDKSILDQDIRKLGLRCSSLPESVVRGDKIQGPVFVQVVKVVDVSRPSKSHGEGGMSENMGMPLFTVTDGTQKFDVAVLFTVPKSLSSSTAPGTKAVMRGDWEVLHGIAIAGYRGSFEFLGGKVMSLFDTWKTNQDVKMQRALFDVSATGSAEAAPKFELFSATKQGSSKHKRSPNDVGSQSAKSGRPRTAPQSQQPAATQPAPSLSPEPSDRVVVAGEASAKAAELLRTRKQAIGRDRDSQHADRKPRGRGGRRGGRDESRRLEEEYRAPARSTGGIGLGDLITNALIEANYRR